MKKYILKVALFVLSMGALMSCEEDTVTYGGQNFVTFDHVASTRLIALEDGGDFEAAVYLAFPRTTDLIVNFTVQSDVAVEGVDYTLPSTSITIPAGEVSANFVVHAIDNTITNDSKPVNVTIESTSDASIAVGISDNGSSYKRLVLLNEDCPTRFTDLLGTFNVYDADNALLGTAEVDINDNGDCDILRISGVVESVLGGEADTYIEITLKPGAGSNATKIGTITSYQQLYCTECYQNPNNGFNETWLLTPSGSFNTITQQLIISGPFSTASGYYQDIASSVVLRRASEN